MFALLFFFSLLFQDVVVLRISMRRIFFDPFPYNLNKVFNLWRLRVSEHRNHFIESFTIFLSCDYLLKNANSCTALSLPVPALSVKCLQTISRSFDGALWGWIKAFQHIKGFEGIKKMTGPVAIICKNLKHDKRFMSGFHSQVHFPRHSGFPAKDDWAVRQC
jgi:hypothetical protein